MNVFLSTDLTQVFFYIFTHCCTVIEVPVIFSFFAVMLQVSDVMIISVGVVATSLTPDQPFDVPCCGP